MSSGDANQVKPWNLHHRGGLSLVQHLNMPTASQGRTAGHWTSYATEADPSMRNRVAAAARQRPQFSAKISWDDHLKILHEYVAREGNAMVPLEHEERGVRLGVWLSRQWSEWQSDTRGGYLSRNRRLQLERAGVNFQGPAPPASGVAGPQSLNERKWDVDDYETIQGAGAAVSDRPKYWHPRPFDATKPAGEGDHWRPYSAESDPALRHFLERRKANGLMAPEEKPKEPYVPLALVPPVKGLGQGPQALALAQRLAKAKEDLERERGSRRASAARPAATSVAKREEGTSAGRVRR